MSGHQMEGDIPRIFREKKVTKGQELEWNSTSQQNTDIYKIRKQKNHGIQESGMQHKRDAVGIRRVVVKESPI